MYFIVYVGQIKENSDSCSLPVIATAVKEKLECSENGVRYEASSTQPPQDQVIITPHSHCYISHYTIRLIHESLYWNGNEAAPANIVSSM